jgi:hypothetical protein
MLKFRTPEDHVDHEVGHTLMLLSSSSIAKYIHTYIELSTYIITKVCIEDDRVSTGVCTR